MTKSATPIGPVSVNESTWFYAESSGLLFVHETKTAQGVVTDQFKVPWRMITAARVKLGKRRAR